jgi:phosphoglycerate dehydrogenase-like enzyme
LIRKKDFNAFFGEPKLLHEVLCNFGKPASVTWIQSSFVGVDLLVGKEMPRNYTLTKMVDVSAPLMSEYVFAYSFSYFRHLKEMEENQKLHKWESLPYESVSTRSILVLGTGSI